MTIQRTLFKIPLLKVKQTQFLALLQHSRENKMTIQRTLFKMPVLKFKQAQFLALLQLSRENTMTVHSQKKLLKSDGKANRAESVTMRA